MKLRIIISAIAFLALFSILLGAVIFFNYIRDKTYDEARVRSVEIVADIADDIDLHIREYSGILSFSSRQGEFINVFDRADTAALANANRQLDSLCSAMEGLDVCYLMDVDGNTIASSNRSAPDSFVGKNYSFRPYFRQAVSGAPAAYAALGVTSKKRGLYYAYPVYSSKDERPSGVIVVKENIEHLRAAIFKPHEGVMMMTGTNGVVFFSNRKDLLYKTVWKVTPEQALEIKESKQFGEGPWEWAGVERTGEHHAVDTAGIEYHIHQKELRSMPGWNILYLHDHGKVIPGMGSAVLKRTGYLLLAITIFFCLLILYLLRMAARDMSLRKKAELILKEERNQAQQYLDIAGVMLALLNTKGEIALINKRGCEILGYDEKEMLNRNWFDLCIREDMRDEISGVFNKLMAGEVEPVEYYENIVINKKGEERMIAFHNAVIRDEVSNITGVLFSGDDITERKQALKDLQNSEAQLKLYQTLINHSNDAIEVLDPETASFLYVNEKGHTDLGYSREEFLSLKVFDIDPIVKPSDFSKIMDRLRRDGSGIWNGVHLRKDGSNFPVEVSLKFVQLDRSYLVSVARDITERKRVEEELERLNEQLIERNKELQHIVYTVSHDLRSPLVNIQGYSRMLALYLEKVMAAFRDEDAAKEDKDKAASIIDKDIPESVSYIISSVSKMDSMLSALLKFSRSTRAELNIEEIDMQKLVSDVMNEIDFQIKASGAKVDAAVLPSCSGDAVQINQVFSNLISNALKYLSPERPGVINVTGNKNDGKTVYCVEDNGIGIPAEEIDNIFDIFHRVDREDAEGEGVGLAIVSKIIERHGGMVWAESEIGKGSKFYVELPCTKAQRHKV